MDSGEALTRVRAARVGRMATVTRSNRPHVVPFVFVLVEHGDARVAYWAVDHKPKRSADLKRIRNLEANPAVEFVVDGYEEDWGRLWWVRCSGTARVVDSESERRSALRALGEKYPQYEVDPPDGPVVAIDIDAIRSWDGATAQRGQSSTTS
jgi:PPOX class probable F420-dependent enzyme